MGSVYEFSFERLDAWKLARQTVVTVYKLLKQFPKDETFGMINQAKRASVSIPSNLAEGSSRSSLKERNHFYEISFGSLVELLTLMTLANDLQYISQAEYLDIRIKIQVLSKVITGLSKSTQGKSQ
jgi:four helix bundle protein